MMAFLFFLLLDFCIYQDEERKNECGGVQYVLKSFSDIYNYFDLNNEQKLNVSFVGNIAEEIQCYLYSTFYEDQINFYGKSNDSSITIGYLSCNILSFENIVLNVENGNIISDHIHLKNCSIYTKKKNFLKADKISIDFQSLKGINFLESNNILELLTSEYKIPNNIPFLVAKEFHFTFSQNNSYIYQLNTKVVTNISGVINQFYTRAISSNTISIINIECMHHIKVGSFVTSPKSPMFNLIISGSQSTAELVGKKWNNHTIYCYISDIYLKSATECSIVAEDTNVHFSKSTRLKLLRSSQISIETKNIFLFFDTLLVYKSFSVSGYHPTIFIDTLSSSVEVKYMDLLNATYGYISSTPSISQVYIEDVILPSNITFNVNSPHVKFNRTTGNSVVVIIPDNINYNDYVLFETDIKMNITYRSMSSKIGIKSFVFESIYGFTAFYNIPNTLCFSLRSCPEGTFYESIEEAMATINYSVPYLQLIEYPGNEIIDLTKFENRITLCLKYIHKIQIDNSSAKMIDVFEAYNSDAIIKVSLNCSLIYMYQSYFDMYIIHYTHEFECRSDINPQSFFKIKADIISITGIYSCDVVIDNNAIIIYFDYHYSYYRIDYFGNPFVNIKLYQSAFSCNVTYPLQVNMILNNCIVKYNDFNVNFNGVIPFKFNLLNTLLFMPSNNKRINGIIEKAVNSSVKTDTEILLIGEDMVKTEGLYFSSLTVVMEGSCRSRTVELGEPSNNSFYSKSLIEYNRLIIGENDFLKESFSAEEIEMRKGSTLWSTNNILKRGRRLEFDIEISMEQWSTIVLEEMSGDGGKLNIKINDKEWDKLSKLIGTQETSESNRDRRVRREKEDEVIEGIEECALGIPILYGMKRSNYNSLRDWIVDSYSSKESSNRYSKEARNETVNEESNEINFGIKIIDEEKDEIQIIEIYPHREDTKIPFTEIENLWKWIPIFYTITSIVASTAFITNLVLSDKKKRKCCKNKELYMYDEPKIYADS